jgi:hypothetical protein
LADICRTKNGVFIPGCMGAAAALGCGQSMKEVMSYCTCEKTKYKKDKLEELEKRIEKIEHALLKICQT